MVSETKRTLAQEHSMMIMNPLAAWKEQKQNLQPFIEKGGRGRGSGGFPII